MPRKLIAMMALTVIGAFGQVAAGRLTGTVVDITGSVIPGALVTVESPMPMAGVTTNPTGQFVLEGIPPGTYTLVLQAAGFHAKELQVQVDNGAETALGHLRLDVVPPPPCTGGFKTSVRSDAKLDSSRKSKLSGSTTVETRYALSNSTITLLESRTQRVIGSTQTDENGRFSYGFVPPGLYELTVSFGGGTTRVRDIRIRKGHELNLRLIWAELPQGTLCL